jgi:hypothetical protein
MHTEQRASLVSDGLYPFFSSNPSIPPLRIGFVQVQVLEARYRITPPSYSRPHTGTVSSKRKNVVWRPSHRCGRNQLFLIFTSTKNRLWSSFCKSPAKMTS